MATTTIRSDQPGSYKGIAADPRAYVAARAASHTPLALIACFALAILSIGVISGSLPAAVMLAALLTVGVGLMMTVQRGLTIQQSLLLGLSHLIGAALLV